MFIIIYKYMNNLIQKSFFNINYYYFETYEEMYEITHATIFFQLFILHRYVYIFIHLDTYDFILSLSEVCLK